VVFAVPVFPVVISIPVFYTRCGFPMVPAMRVFPVAVWADGRRCAMGLSMGIGVVSGVLLVVSGWGSSRGLGVLRGMLLSVDSWCRCGGHSRCHSVDSSRGCF